MDSYIEITCKILLSIIIGGIIGAEREFHSKSAGFRTIMMICLGSCLFTMFSIWIGTGSPDRIASNILTGIGFIGAGVIFRADRRVNGITTAATIWVAAALGMGVGSGHYITSTIASILVIALLTGLNWLEIIIDRLNQLRTYRIVVKYEKETMKRFEDLYKEYHLTYRNLQQIKTGDELTGVWIVNGSQKNHELFVLNIMNDSTVKDFEF